MRSRGPLALHRRRSEACLPERLSGYLTRQGTRARPPRNPQVVPLERQRGHHVIVLAGQVEKVLELIGPVKEWPSERVSSFWVQ